MVPISPAGKIVFIALLCLFTATIATADSEQCLKCHADIVGQALEKFVIHPPFSQNNCSLCHSSTTTIEATAESTEKYSEVETNIKTEWLAESFTESTLQIALLEKGACDSYLTVKLWYHNHEKQQKEIPCPNLAAIPTKNITNQTPRISKLHMKHYNSQLFSRATVAWTTDSPCRCQLLYRSDNKDYVDNEDDFYAVTHHHEIRNFNPSNTQVSIHCSDIFEQRTQLPYASLAALPLQQSEENVQATQNRADCSINFMQVNDTIEVSVATTQPAAVAIGRPMRLESGDNNNLTSNTAGPLPEKTPTHPPMAAEKQVNTTVCFQCHKETVEVASHPINIIAPPGMIIPKEYPLLSDGRMTCMTCHTRHSSNNEARLLKGGKKELCTGCHTNY